MSNAEPAFDDRTLGLIGGGSAVAYVVAFAAVGELALESLPYGIIAGLFAGVGAYLFLPWFLRLSATQNESDDDRPFSEIVQQVDGNAQLGAVGFGLELGAILMLVAGFSLEEPDLFIGTGVAIAATLVVSIIASVLLNR